MRKLESYLEQLKHYAKDGAVTAQAFIKAAEMTGDVSDILPEILSIADTHGIPADALAEITARNASIQAHNRRQEMTEKLSSLSKRYADLADKATAMTDAEFKKASAELHAETASLAASADAAPVIITAKELMSKTFPARKWIVDDLISPGLTILSGAPKIGKSWLMLSLAEAVSCGGKFLGELKADNAGVLHLALEETERSIYERRQQLGKKDGNSTFRVGNNNIRIATQWTAGVSGLNSYLTQHRDIRLVIIDTLGRFLPEIEDMNDYAKTVIPLSGLKKTADDLDIAILAVHHAKKGNQGKDWMDSSLGSQGIVGTADATLVLQRDPDDNGTRKNTGKLYATGRSIKDYYSPVVFNPDIGAWTIDGKTTPQPQPDVNPNGSQPRKIWKP